jgi:SAM-dependent methyltransferase
MKLKATDRVLFLCHGRVHTRHRSIAGVTVPDAVWSSGYYVDSNKYTLPDKVAAVSALTAKSFPADSFDAIAIVFCPCSTDTLPPSFFKRAVSWLKPGGILIMSSIMLKSTNKGKKLHDLLLSLKGTAEYLSHKAFILQSKDKDLKDVLHIVETAGAQDDEVEMDVTTVVKNATCGLLTVKHRRDGGVVFVKDSA